MKAAQISQFGDASVISVNDIDTPSISADQVLVKVSASSINPFDGAMRGGTIESLAEHFPFTLGLDIAGTVTEVGENVTDFAVGDRVYGSANIMGGASGGFAEYAAVNSDRIAKTPESISDEDAASLPTAGITALQAMVDNGQISEGQKVFINGGSGGVGVIAIQVAKALGAYVATTASAGNAEFVKSLGADEVIDYKTTNYVDVLSGYDLALNNAHGDQDDILKVLKDGGIAVTVTGSFNEEAASKRSITPIGQYTDVTKKSLDELAGMISDGKVKPVVAKTYSLDQIVDAYTDKESGSTPGKIVITIA